MQAYRRQKPISCHLCRSKKLKCDRKQPCSNCSARGVTCDFNQARPAQQAEPSSHHGPSDEIPAILARLDRLEEAVLSARGESLAPLTPHARQSSTAVAPQPSPVPEEYARWREYQSFERTSIPDRSLVFRKYAGLKVEAAKYDSTGPTVASFDHVHTSILLPSQTDAAVLMQRYLEQVDYHCHIIHGPTLRALLSTLYASLPFERCYDPGRVALLLAVFASTAYFWRLSPTARCLFQSSQESLEAARVWGIAALDILELSRRIGTNALEDVQATIIGNSLFYYTEGYSLRTRLLQTMAITMARDLGLHRVDFPKRPVNISASTAVENEIKRRVWWHLASKDWLLAFAGGQQEGTYCVQLRQMRVDYPQNLDDEDIPADGSEKAVDLSLPTSMSFFLQQIRLANVCRAITDKLSPFPAPLQHRDHDTTMAMDHKLQEFLDKLPPFFRLGTGSLSCSHPIHAARPYLIWQRNLINIELHIRRSKLHQPFLCQGAADDRYASSREICLSSACTVIEASSLNASADRTSNLFPTRLAAVVHHVFMAAMILVLELSYNKQAYKQDQQLATASEQGAQYRAAIVEACSMLERAATNSLMAANFLNTFIQILQKHQVTWLTQESNEVGNEIPAGASDMTAAEWLIQDNAIPAEFPPQANGSDGTGLTALLQGYIDFSPAVEVTMWQGLFAELDSWHHDGPVAD